MKTHWLDVDAEIVEKVWGRTLCGIPTEMLDVFPHWLPLLAENIEDTTCKRCQRSAEIKYPVFYGKQRERDDG